MGATMGHHKQLCPQHSRLRKVGSLKVAGKPDTRCQQCPAAAQPLRSRCPATAQALTRLCSSTSTVTAVASEAARSWSPSLAACHQHEKATL